MEQKTVFSLLSQEKYPYFKNHYVPSSNEVLLQKEHFISVILSPKLTCLQQRTTRCTLQSLQTFDEKKIGTLRGNFVKNAL